MNSKTKIDCFFSGENNISDILANELNNAKNFVLLAMYTLTDRKLVKTLIEIKNCGIQVFAIFDEAQLINYPKIAFDLNNGDINFKTTGNANARMHHKFVVIDNLKIITGSFNWTDQAVKSNMENIIIIENQNTAKRYADEFDRIWHLITYKNISFDEYNERQTSFSEKIDVNTCPNCGESAIPDAFRIWLKCHSCGWARKLAEPESL